VNGDSHGASAGLINIVSWNVCGVKEKVNDNYFWDFINDYDIVFLLETFISEQDWGYISKKFYKFKTYTEHVVRTAIYGRSRGGIIYLINKQSRFADKLSFVDCGQYTLIQINTGSNNDVWVLPLYLNFNLWDREFEKLSNFLREHDFIRLMIMGDLNRRIGLEQNFTQGIVSEINTYFKDSRMSKDSLVNSRGKQVLKLVEDLGLIVLNGRAVGDESGDFTYIGPVGCSVIDLAAVSMQCLHLIRGFKILSHTGSDHLPIEVMVGVEAPGVEEGRQVLPLLPKLRWTSKDDLFYAARVNRHMARFELCHCDQNNINNIIKIITDSAQVKLTACHKPIKQKQPWFDYECLALRKRKFKLLNAFRKTNSSEVKSKYNDACKEFKLVCKLKQKLFLEKIISNLNQATNTKACWQAINSFKQGSVKIIGNISTNDWVGHFRNLLNPPLLSSAISYAEPLIRDEVLDAPFTMTELKDVLAAVKAGKAPGFDRVPYCFF